jgi:hypothetical protein
MNAAFSWQVADSGYQFETFLTTARKRLVYDPETTWTRYPALRRYTGLFRIFGGLKGDDAILRFANQYGLLGTWEYRNRISEEIQEELEYEAGRRAMYGQLTSSSRYWESLETWLSAIQKMRDTIRLWDATQGADYAYLRQVIRWRKNPKRVSYQDGHSSIAGRHVHPDGSSIKFGETLWPAWLFIQDRINDVLASHVAPMMLWNEDNELKLVYVPRTLLGAMWLQFADAVTYNLEYRECGWCGRSFEITRATRSDRLYCSNSCRVSASRKRTRSAKRK